MSRQLADLQPGDQALLVNGWGSREPRMVTITKRGRKYLTIGEGWTVSQFDMHTGWEKIDSNYGATLWIPEQYEAHLEAAKMRKELREAGVETWPVNLTDDQIAAIHKIVCGEPSRS